MHLATYSAADAGAMLAHYERRIGAREHIDPAGRVYNAAPDFGGPQARFRELCDGLEIGARTRPLADLIVTLPQGCEIPQEEFFEECYKQLTKFIWGEERVVSAYVHLDEPGAQPHMHFAFVPIVQKPVMTNDKTRPLLWTKEDQEKNPEHVAGTQKLDSKGTPRWERVPLRDADGNQMMRRTASASQLISRNALRNLHPSLEHELCKHFGVERVGLMLDAQDAKKTLSQLDHRQYEEATKEIARTEQRLQQATKQVAEKQADLQRLEGLRRSQEAENSGLDQRIGDLEAAIERCKQEPSAELERGQQPDAEPEQAKWGHELAETAKLVQAAGFGGVGRIEEEQRAEAATARDLDSRIEQAKEGQRAEAENAESSQQSERERHESEVGRLGRGIEQAEGELRGLRGRYSGLEQRVEELQQRLEGLVERFTDRIRELAQNLGLERACERVGTWLCERQEAIGSRLFDAEYEFRGRFGGSAERFYDEYGRLKDGFDLQYERETGEWPVKQQPLADAAEVARDASQHIERGRYGIDDIIRDIERAEHGRGTDDDGGDDGSRWREIPARYQDYDRGLER